MRLSEPVEVGSGPGPGGSAVPVHRIELRSAEVRVEVLTLGAALHRVVVPDAAGVPGDVHLVAPDLGLRLRASGNPYLGVTVGRCSNRIAGARFPLDGRIVAVDANEGPNQLHGGPDGFHRRVWTAADRAEAPDGGHVTFALVSTHGDQGYPGTVRAEATYRLAGAVLAIELRATTDAPTVVDLCNHAYWNLDGVGPVLDHQLEVAAERYLPVDAAGIPSGGPTPVAGTPFDLRRSIRVGDAVAATGGLDHSYEVGPLDAHPPRVRLVARLRGPRSGRELQVRTDRPALQVYAGAHLADPFAPFDGICLEAQAFPDTANRPELGSVVLRPGEAFRSTTELHFGRIGG